MNLKSVRESLPEQFDFYHLGSIQKASSEASRADLLITPDSINLSYLIHGDERGVFLVSIAPGLDLSMYSEVGNILASRLSQGLSQAEDKDLLVSPPKPIPFKKALELIKSNSSWIHQTYVHQHGGQLVSIQTYVCLAPIYPGALDV